MKTIILLSASVLFLGCSPIYYVPNTQNVPIMKAKDQFNLSIGLNTSESTDGFEIQSACAVTDKIAVQLNGFWTNQKDESIETSGNLIEFGVGYFKKLNSSFVFETYGLLGFGGMKYKSEYIYNSYYYSDSNYGNIRASIFRVGLQPSISYSKKYFTASFSSRIANLNYSNISGDYTSSHEGFYYETDYLKANNSLWLLEPALTLQAGFEEFKLQLQYIHSYNLTNPEFYQDFEMISLSLLLSLNPKKK